MWPYPGCLSRQTRVAPLPIKHNICQEASVRPILKKLLPVLAGIIISSR